MQIRARHIRASPVSLALHRLLFFRGRLHRIGLEDRVPVLPHPEGSGCRFRILQGIFSACRKGESARRSASRAVVRTAPGMARAATFAEIQFHRRCQSHECQAENIKLGELRRPRRPRRRVRVAPQIRHRFASHLLAARIRHPDPSQPAHRETSPKACLGFASGFVVSSFSNAEKRETSPSASTVRLL